jgi:hypothetical protein
MNYFGKYFKFYTTSKEDAAQLMSADNLIGDYFSLKTIYSDNQYKTLIINKFNKEIAFLNATDSKQIALLQTANLEITTLLSFIAFTESSDEGYYWGEVAVIAYDKKFNEAMNKYIKKISNRIKTGIRPDIDLTGEGFNKIIESNGEWTPAAVVSFPNKEKGTVVLKKQQSVLDKLTEEGRKKNKGCYIASWLFILVIVFLIALCAKSCGLF